MPLPSAATTVLLAGFEYVRRNPLSVVTVARHAARMRAVVPLDVVRWGLSRIKNEMVSDFSVSAQPPGLGLGVTVNVMGNRLRVGAVLHIDEIQVGKGLLRVEVRVKGLTVDALDGNGGGPIQALLSSGAIDLNKPGKLLAFLPKRPALLVEADDDRFVLDLMQIRALAKNPMLARMAGLISPVLSIRDVATAGDDLLIGVRITPSGLPSALASLRM